MTAAIVEAIDASDGELNKRKLAGVIIKAFKAPKKSKAVKMASDTDFLSDSEDWEFDADEGILYAA